MPVYPELVGLIGWNVPNYQGVFLRGYGSQTSYHYGAVGHWSAGLGELPIGERESLCGSECCSPKVGGHKYELSQQTEQKKLKEKIHKPPPFVAKPEYRAEKQHDRTHPRKDSTHDNLHDGAPQWDVPG